MLRGAEFIIAGHSTDVREQLLAQRHIYIDTYTYTNIRARTHRDLQINGDQF